jgi:hypothetical protein
MNLTVRHVESTHVQQVWPMVAAFIEDALSKIDGTPDYNIHHVQSFLANGQWLLLVAVDEEGVVHGATTVSFINYPLHRVAFITAIGGKLISNQETFDQLRNLMKSFGATKIQGLGRPAIVRLWSKYNFEPRNTLVEVLI